MQCGTLNYKEEYWAAFAVNAATAVPILKIGSVQNATIATLAVASFLKDPERLGKREQPQQ